MATDLTHPDATSPDFGAQLLPRTWRQTLPEEQHEWVGRALFRRRASGQVVLTADLQLWWYPPGPQALYTQPPTSAHPFFQRPFFLWVPYRMWAYHLRCCVCGGMMTGAGLYKTVRRVLDKDGWYFMGTEYLECSACHKKVAGWSPDILSQLDFAHRLQFPAILTYKLSCDKYLLGHLKERTLGNSASRLRAILLEQHTEDWMRRSMLYLSVLRKFQVPASHDVFLPLMQPVPSASWLISVYVRDALTRQEETKARITSIFGEILKMNANKKVTKKLVGSAAGTASCITSVSNEYGQVLMSVLTVAEGDGLANMATGLMRRYREARKAHPKVMYVDRDCCANMGKGKTAELFHEWDELVVRLDVWHFMQSFARGVTNIGHQLYGLFMASLSFAIFKWDEGDIAHLAKSKEAHIKLPGKELACHCRRQTRGVAETERLLQEVLDDFWEKTDKNGTLLINHARMEEIWSMQRRHLACIQDPEGVELYTKTGELTKGGGRLPVYRCARGSTSLESFHLHMNRFIPGTSANDVHFQVYLLEGLVRWNENRGRAAVEGAQPEVMRCYDAQMQHAFDQLTQEFWGLTLVEDYTKPGEYTGELIGVEYLYSQTGAVLQQDSHQDPDAPDGTEEAENLEEEEEEELEDIRILSHHLTLLQSATGSTTVAIVDDSPSHSGPVPVPPSQTLPVPSAPQAVAELLFIPQTLQQQPKQPDQPHQPHVPEDASGLAVTYRGPLAPEVYDLDITRDRLASTSDFPQPSTSTGATPSTSEAAGSALSSASAAAGTSSGSTRDVPRSTAWRWKICEDKERRAREEGELFKGHRKAAHFNCRLCGQPKTKEYGHSRYRNESFCSRADGRTVEQWLEEKKLSANPDK